MVANMLDYVVVQASCQNGHTRTAYGETEEFATEQLAEEFHRHRNICDECGILAMFDR